MTAAIIRRACTADYTAVGNLLSGLDELHRTNVPWMFKQADFRTPELIAELVSRDDSAVFVAETDDADARP